MNKSVLTLATLGLTAVSAFSSTISVNDGGASGNKFLSSAGQVLSTATVMVGYIEGFNANDAALMGKLTGGSLAQVLSVFVPLGVDFNRGGQTYKIGNTSTISYNTSTGVLSGNVGSVSPIGAVDGSQANLFQGSNGLTPGTRLFVLALNQVGTAVTQTTEFALVGADPSVSTAWTMPSANLTNRSLVMTAVDVESGAGDEYFWGIKGSILLQPDSTIPEPSSLGLLAFLGAIGLRRRR